MQYWYVYPSMRHKNCLQMHHHVSPPTFGVDILLLLLYSNIYTGLRSFVLVLWMQRQCPVVLGFNGPLRQYFSLYRAGTSLKCYV